MNGKTIVDVECTACGDTSNLIVNEANYYEWLDRRMLAQDAFPDLSPGDRELLISRTCEFCFDSMFGDDEFGSELA